MAKRFYCTIGTFFICLLVAASLYADAVRNSDSRWSPDVFEYKDGLMTLKCKNTPFLELLSKVVDMTGVEIFLYSLSSDCLSIGFEKRTLQEALTYMLRGCNYVALYTKRKAVHGLHVRILSNVYSKETVTDVSIDQKKEHIFNFQIDTIKRRLMSGASDREYKKWSEIRGTRYIEHDSERLERYERLLKQTNRDRLI